jgi:hypothetical protein
MKQLALPFVHGNGSGRKALLEGFSEAHKAVRAAEEALKAIYPHGRDYYPLGGNVYSSAREQMNKRLETLAEIREELETLAASVE